MQLQAEHEALALRQLALSYGQVNQTLFGGRLERPPLRFTGAEQGLGRYSSRPRGIELSRRILSEHGWAVLVEVLKHEMAHQYVMEVLGVDEPAHGPRFRQICAERGIDPSATGVPTPTTSETAIGKLLSRVEKLLALAQSQNQHEAEAAMAAAQRLMLKHNLTPSAERQHNYTFRFLGSPKGRVMESERLLASLLTTHFFVEGLWVPVWRPRESKRGSQLEICGSPENVELASYAYSFLQHTKERLWAAHQAERKSKSNKERQSFLSGVMVGFQEKLERERQASSEEGLVWLGDPELARYFKRRHPSIRWSYYGGSGEREGFAAGKRAGGQIVLHRGVSQGPSGPIRLLSGKRS